MVSKKTGTNQGYLTQTKKGIGHLPLENNFHQQTGIVLLQQKVETSGWERNQLTVTDAIGVDQLVVVLHSTCGTTRRDGDGRRGWS